MVALPHRYGNPDGYHGTSVTIGLPSWLTNKDNELAILVAYFVALIVVIPTVVGLWCAAPVSAHSKRRCPQALPLAARHRGKRHHRPSLLVLCGARSRR